MATQGASGPAAMPGLLAGDGAAMMTSDRITAYFFGAVALGCLGAVVYLLTRWWMGQ